MILPKSGDLFWQTTFAASPNRLDGGALTETLLWTLVFILFLVLGLAILLKLRKEAKESRYLNRRTNDGSIDRFRDLYEKNLITFDEFQMIRKNIRDKLVYEVVHQDLPRKNDKRGKDGKTGVNKKGGDSGLSEKERRLKSLLRQMEESD